MRRLTISGYACTETLRLLIAMAWADGRLDENEKAGVRGAAEVLNLSKEFRDKLDEALATALPLDLILLDALSPRDRSFAYVAAAWMSGVDSEVDEKEKALLDKLATQLGFGQAHRAELEAIARDLPAPPTGGRSWGDEVVSLFRAIPARLEKVAPDDIEVTFE